MSQSFLFFAPPNLFRRRPLAACSQGQEEFELSDSVIRLTLAALVSVQKRKTGGTTEQAGAMHPPPSAAAANGGNGGGGEPDPLLPPPPFPPPPPQPQPQQQHQNSERALALPGTHPRGGASSSSDEESSSEEEEDATGSSLRAPWTQRRAPSAARAPAAARPACLQKLYVFSRDARGVKIREGGAYVQAWLQPPTRGVPLRRESRRKDRGERRSTPVTGRTP